jgi:hypothetical protein
LDGTLDDDVVWAGHDAKKLRDRATKLRAALAGQSSGQRDAEGERIGHLLGQLAAQGKNTAAPTSRKMQ